MSDKPKFLPATPPDYDCLKTQQYFRHLLNDKIHFCGCGSVDKWGVLLAMLERSEAQGSFYKPWNDWPGDAVEFVAHVMDGWGLTEHGGSVGHAWLTDEGKFALIFL